MSRAAAEAPAGGKGSRPRRGQARLGAPAPREAATVIIVRPASPADAASEAGEGGVRSGDAGHARAPIEVLMLRRHVGSEFGGGYVFPGGSVDDVDRSEQVATCSAGRSEPEASSLLGVETGGLSSFVAAIRECFEEAGILFARDRSGHLVSFEDPEAAARFRGHRRALNEGDATLPEICSEEDLRLALDALVYFSHWITPSSRSRRYDTRFFVAEAPAGQTAAHDDGETVDAVWIEPTTALERAKSGEMLLLLPTQKNLEAIGSFDGPPALIEAARNARQVMTVRPRESTAGGKSRILLPGDTGYDELGPG